MAEEIRVTGGDDVEIRAESVRAERNMEAMPNDPGAVRQEIEHTRARMSETIDEIEEQLLRKKEEIKDRLDIFSVVRERPMQSLGMVLGAGLLLGLVTGGDDEEEETERHYRARVDVDSAERADTWEHRARRLLNIAQEQEAELERLRMRRSDLDSRAEMDDHEDATGASMFDKLQDAAAERVSDFVRDSVQRMLRGGF